MKTFSPQILTTAAAAVFTVALALPATGLAAAAGEDATPAASQMEHPKAAMMHHAKASAEVKAAQEALDNAGFKLKADGIMGRHTRAAIKAYQKKNGLKVTGRLDKETKAHLHVQ